MSREISYQKSVQKNNSTVRNNEKMKIRLACNCNEARCETTIETKTGLSFNLYRIDSIQCTCTNFRAAESLSSKFIMRDIRHRD